LNKLYINKIDYTEYASGLDAVVETYSEKEDGSIEVGQSSTIILKEKAYTDLRAIILEDSCSSINNEYDVRIHMSKCSLSLDFVLKSQGVSFDDTNCTCKINLNAKNPKEAQFEILNNHVFWNKTYGFLDWALARERVLKMLQFYEVGFMSAIVASLWFTAMKPLIYAINLIIDFLNAAAFWTDDKIKKIDDLDGDNDALGGGEYNTHYYLKDIFEFWAGKAGLTFRSSIFQDIDYKNSVLWSVQNGHGVNLSNHKTWHVVEDNLQNSTPVQLLNSVRPPFNAQWKIIGPDLIFERKDHFDTIRLKAFNLEQEFKKGNILDGYEYSFDNTPNYARFISAFSSDSMDIQGNKALKYYRYNKEWNPGLIHKNRKGDKLVDIQYGGVRCTEDFGRSSFLSYFWRNFAGPGNALNDSPDPIHCIVIEKELCQLPKLLIVDHYETWQGTKFWRVKKTQISQPSNPTTDFDKLDFAGEYEYNVPFWMVNLYNRFHYIDDPDLNNKRIIEIRNLKWRPTNFCEAVEFLRLNKLNTYIETKIGKGNIGGFEIDYGKCLIKFDNVTFKCQ